MPYSDGLGCVRIQEPALSACWYVTMLVAISLLLLLITIVMSLEHFSMCLYHKTIYLCYQVIFETCLGVKANDATMISNGQYKKIVSNNNNNNNNAYLIKHPVSNICIIFNFRLKIGPNFELYSFISKTV